ncbi:MAG: XrtA/PEP-CTERM system TPR-repeat protein PrsT [Pseudomonadota bacterium]
MITRPNWPRRARTLCLALPLLAAACQRHDDSASLMADAARYRQRGDVKSATIQLKNVLQREPGQRLARQQLGELYLQSGDPVSAEKELRRALELGASVDIVAPMIGKALLMQGQFERVLEQVSVAGTPVQRAAAIALRANACLGLGKIEEAARQFEQALALDGASADAMLGLSRLAVAKGKTKQAMDMIERALAAQPKHIDALRFKGDLQRAQGQGQLALPNYERILALNPADAQAHLDIANVRIDAGQFQQARADIGAARKLASSSVAVVHASALLDFREGKTAAALDGLQQVLRSAPDHMPSILLSGAVQLALASPQQAEQHLQRYLAAYPRHAYAVKLMATAQLQQGRPDAAIAQLAPLLSDGADDGELLTLAGEAHMRARHFAQASEYFERASALQPDMPMLHTALALSRLGTGDSARAVAELERAAALGKMNARTGVLLVMAYLRNQDSDKALSSIERMENTQSNPLIQNLKGLVYLARQDLARARTSFEHALRIDPQFMPALDNLVQVDLLEKKPDQARQRLDAALARAPRNAALMDAQARLAERSGKQPDALAWLEKSYAAQPDSAAAGLRLGAMYLRAGAAPKALLLAQKLQAANPARADALGLLAQAQLANGDATGAIDSDTKLAALLPRSVPVQLHLAQAQLRAGDTNAAMAALKKALAIDPAQLDAQSALHGLLLGRKAYPQAMAIATAVQKQHPEAALGDKLEGDVFLAQEQALPALKAYERAFAREPSGPALIATIVALQRAGKSALGEARMKAWLAQHPADTASRLYWASAKLVNKEFAAAMEQFEIVLKSEPDNIVALNDMAWASQQTGDQRARGYAERAYRLAPGSPAVLDTLGWIYQQAGDAKHALPLLQKAAAGAPDAANIGVHLAEALAKSGDKEGARKQCELLLARQQSFPQRAQVKAMLAAL